MESNFDATVWGDFFINYIPPTLQKSEEWMKERADQLKDEVRKLFGLSNDAVKMMNLVDELQHLGIDHHFEEQIVHVLSIIHSVEFNSSNLRDVALRFRLLRQHGFWISPDEFNKFTSKDGIYSAETADDPRGLLSLYNAAHLLIHGEDVLEDAILFSRHHLESMTSKLESPLAEQVKRSLQIPIPRRLKRIEALQYISEYKHENAYNPSLLELAKLDFNLLQRLHMMELKTISQWWKDLQAEVGLNYSRDRIVECYFWSHSVYYEQKHTRARLILAKFFALASLLDDTYDVYATLDESRKLHEAIQIWDLKYIPLLPEYLKKYYVKLITSFEEMEDELGPDEKFHIAYGRKAFQTLSRHYFQEAEWFHNGYMPSFQQHLNLSVITSGAPMLSVALLVGMGDVATKDAFEWAISCTDAVRASGEVTRFVDDLAAFKHGKNKMDIATTIECYMHEHHVPDEVAIAKMESLVEDAWKTTNQAHFERGTLLPVVKRVANLTRSMAFLFQNKRDAYTFSKYNKETIEQQFVKSITL
ncbi:hypothetical protein ACP70R_009215 [Stipagrostis hirtigluma subsp. patula]